MSTKDRSTEMAFGESTQNNTAPSVNTEGGVRDPFAHFREDDDQDGGEFEFLGGKRALLTPQDDDSSAGRDDSTPESADGVAGSSVDDVEMGEDHRGQELRPPTDRMGDAVADANAPTDNRSGLDPDTGGRLDIEVGEVLDRDTEDRRSQLVDEERQVGREHEIEKTRTRAVNGQQNDPDREKRTRESVVDEPIGDFDQPDDHIVTDDDLLPAGIEFGDEAMALEASEPLAGLEEEIQEKAASIADTIVDDHPCEWSVEAVQRLLGKRLRARDGELTPGDVTSVGLALSEDLKPYAPKTSLGNLGDQPWHRVDLEAEVAQLWDNDDESIFQVGLLASTDPESDETVKVTIWNSATESGLTSDYDEPGFPTQHVPAMWGKGLQEGETVSLDHVKQTWDNKGRPCLEVDRRANGPGKRRPTKV